MPQLRHKAAERPFDREEGGLGQLGRLQPGRRLGIAAGEEQRPQIEAQRLRQDLAAFVQLAAEKRLAAVDLGGHAGMLRALAGEEEDRPAAAAPRPGAAGAARRRARG